MKLRTMSHILVDCAATWSVSRCALDDRTAMDAFENLAADNFSNYGYWVRTGVKVGLTPADKAAIKLPSSPRWRPT
jgi:hypothetical protein